MVESLKLSLTDQQLPMFIRLMELGVALYYGEMGVHRDAEKEESGSLRESVSGEFLILLNGFVSEAEGLTGSDVVIGLLLWRLSCVSQSFSGEKQRLSERFN